MEGRNEEGRAPVIKDQDIDFEEGRANKKERNVGGGRKTIIAMMPEEGNFLIDLNSPDHFVADHGRLVAKIRNDGRYRDNDLALEATDSAYWFVELDGASKQLRTYIVNDKGAVLKDYPFDVCHWKPDNYPGWTSEVADLVDYRSCDPPPASTRRTRRQDFYGLGPWIPCVQGCCMAGSSGRPKRMPVRKEGQ